jgi:hypothetical protein
MLNPVITTMTFSFPTSPNLNLLPVRNEIILWSKLEFIDLICTTLNATTVSFYHKKEMDNEIVVDQQLHVQTN